MRRPERRSKFPQFTVRLPLMAMAVCGVSLTVVTQAEQAHWRFLAVALPAILFGFWLGFVSEHLDEAAAKPARFLAGLIGLAGATTALCGVIALILALLAATGIE